MDRDLHFFLFHSELAVASSVSTCSPFVIVIYELLPVTRVKDGEKTMERRDISLARPRDSEWERARRREIFGGQGLEMTKKGFEEAQYAPVWTAREKERSDVFDMFQK